MIELLVVVVKLIHAVVWLPNERAFIAHKLRVRGAFSFAFAKNCTF